MEPKDKSFFYRTSYLRSIAILFGMLIFVIVMVSQLIKQENRYLKEKGTIIESYGGKYTSLYYIVLDTKNNDTFITDFTNNFPILTEKATVGKNVIVWYNIEGSTRFNRHKISGKYIKKLIVDNEIIIPYHKGIGLRVFFICLAIVVFVLNLIYIIKNPAHLKGKRDESV